MPIPWSAAHREAPYAAYSSETLQQQRMGIPASPPSVLGETVDSGTDRRRTVAGSPVFALHRSFQFQHDLADNVGDFLLLGLIAIKLAGNQCGQILAHISAILTQISQTHEVIDCFIAIGLALTT